MIVYKLTSPVLLPFLMLVFGLNALFNRDMVWALAVRGGERLGYNPGSRTLRWDQRVTLIGGISLILVLVVFSLSV